jgi:hypothetical protein
MDRIRWHRETALLSVSTAIDHRLMANNPIIETVQQIERDSHDEAAHGVERTFNENADDFIESLLVDSR